MSANFTLASSQYLLNSAPPFTGPPFTVGAWVKQADTNAGKIVWSLVDGTSATANGWEIGFGLSHAMQTMVAGTTTTLSTGGGTTAWTFILARWISSTNRQLTVLRSDGGLGVASSVTSLVPTVTPNRSAIGARVILTPDNFFNGSIAELWWTNTDIQPDGGATNSDIFRQLAYNGPFSIPHIAKDIVDYRSLRTLGSDQDDVSDYFTGNNVRQIWVNTNGVTLGPDVPVSSLYVRPNDSNLLTPRWFRSYPDTPAGGGAVTKFQSYFIG